MVADPVRGVDYPATYQQLLRWFPDNARVPGVPGSVALGGRVRLPGVRRRPVLAHRRGPVDVPGLPAADLGDGGDDLPPHPHADVDVVRGDLVRDLTEERDVRAGPAAGPRVRLLRDGVGVAAQAAPGDGPPGPGPAVRDRRGRRDDRRRRQPRHVRGRHRQGPGDDRGGTQRRSPSRPGPARRRRPARQPRPGRLGRRGDRARLDDQDRRRTGAAPARRPRLHPPGHRRPTAPPTSPPCCPACTWSPPCSNAGSSAPCTTASSSSTCPTTSTSTPSASTAAPHASRGLLFYRLLQQAVNTDPHPLHELLRPRQGSWDDFT